jgi:hypothetical protein
MTIQECTDKIRQMALERGLSADLVSMLHLWKGPTGWRVRLMPDPGMPRGIPLYNFLIWFNEKHANMLKELPF